MPEEVLESFVRQYIEAQQAPVISFVWQGGEPTLRGLDFTRRPLRCRRNMLTAKDRELLPDQRRAVE